jgi:alkanesulfonate monooxygenase
MARHVTQEIMMPVECIDMLNATFSICGFDPLEDALQYGRDVMPLVRAEIARCDTASRVLDAVAGQN